MASRGGLYWRIRDKSLPWCDRVKLLRYAWVNDTVYLPNKHQVLLDWLTQALAGKKRVESKDALPVWRCLSEVLGSSQCNNGHDPIVLKPNVIQVLLEELQACKKTSHQELVLKSCLNIAKSPVLAPALMYKFDNVISLLTSLLKIINVSSTNVTSELLAIVVDKLRGIMAKRDNAQQTAQQVSLRLFPVAVTCCQSEEVMGIIVMAFCARDIEKYYKKFLDIKTGIEQLSESNFPPKFLVALFDQIEKGLKDSDSMMDYLKFVPHFYKGFLGAYKNSALGFQQFQYFCDVLIGLKIPSEAEAVFIETFSKLLGLVCEYDVYDASTDVLDAHSHLKVVMKVMEVLMKQSSRSSVGWYRCLTTLLQLNHTTIESRIQTVLAEAWINRQQGEEQPLSADVLSSQDEFLCQLVDVYSKLRQIPRLYSKLCLTVKKHPTCQPTWPPRFTKRLSECITNLPQTVMLEVWRLLLTETKDCFPDIQLLPLLFSHFLEHVQLVDYSVTVATTAAVTELMQEMWTQILKPYLQSVIQKKQPASSSCLSLLKTWGDMQIVLTNYVKSSETKYAGLGALETTLTSIDLSYVYPDLGPAEWKKLLKLMEDSKVVGVKVIRCRLLTQKIRAVLLFSGNSTETSKNTNCETTTVQNALEMLFSELQAYDTLKGNSAVWNGQISSLDDSSAPVALWEDLLRHLPIMLSCLTEEQTDSVARLLANHLKQPTATSQSEMSLQSLVWQFVSSPSFCESFELQDAVMKRAWMNVMQTSATKKSPAKKRKSLASSSAFGTVLGKLAGVGNTEQDVEEWLMKSLEETQTETSEKLAESIQEIWQIFGCLPLEHLTLQMQTSLFIGILAMMPKLDSAPNRHKLVATGFTLLTTLVENMKELKLNIGKVICWLMEFQGRQMEKAGEMASLFPDLIIGLLKIATRGHEELNSVEVLVKKLSCLKASKLKEPTPDKEVQVHVYVLSLQYFSKAVTMHKLSDENRQIINKYYTALVDVLLSLTKKNLDKQLDRYPQIVAAFASVLNQKIKAARKSSITVEENDDSDREEGGKEEVMDISKTDDDVEIDETDDEIRVLLDLIEPVCEHCLRRMQKTKLALPHLQFLLTLFHNFKFVKSRLPAKSLQIWWQNLISALEHTNFKQTNENVSHSSSTNQIQGYIQKCLAAIVAVASKEELHGLLAQLAKNLIPALSADDIPQVLVTMEIWQQLLELNLQEEPYAILGYACQELVLQLQYVMLAEKNKEEKCRDDRVTVKALELLTKMLTHGQSLLSPPHVLACLHSAHVCPLPSLDTTSSSSSDLASSSKTAVVSALYDVANSLLVHHSSTVLQAAVPAYCAVVKRLLGLVMEHGGSSGGDRGDAVEGWAMLVVRLLNLLVQYKTDIGKVAPYMVADYVCHLQNVTLLPIIKKSLLPGIYKLLSLCDNHSVALLHTALPAGTKEIFRTLHDEYRKYYKYKGKV